MNHGSTTEKFKRKQWILLGLLRVRLLEQSSKGTNLSLKAWSAYFLKPFVRSIKSHRPQSGTTSIKLLHDNARPHIHKNVKNYLKSQHIKVIDHPPDSPDLVPLDFWLFNEIKRRIPGQIDHRSMRSLIKEILCSIPNEEYLKTFSKLIEKIPYPKNCFG